MKVLLDESLPRRLKQGFRGVDVQTVPEAGWAGLSNGELLETASPHFDVFVTADQNLTYQQNLSNYAIAIVVLVTKTNRLLDLEPLIPNALARMSSLSPGEVARVGA